MTVDAGVDALADSGLDVASDSVTSDAAHDARLDSAPDSASDGGAIDSNPGDAQLEDTAVDVSVSDSNSDAGDAALSPLNEIPPQALPAGPDYSGVVQRQGPTGAVHLAFRNTLQKGGYWELENGDILTALQTERTQPRPGWAVYDYHYRYRRIGMHGAVTQLPNTVVGTCRDDGTNRGCNISPTPDGPNGLSVTMPDGQVLRVGRAYQNDRSFPGLSRLNVDTGLWEVVASYMDLIATREDRSYDTYARLALLADGTLALSGYYQGPGAWTLHIRADGTELGRTPGYFHGERRAPFALLVTDELFTPRPLASWWDFVGLSPFYRQRESESIVAMRFVPTAMGDTYLIHRDGVTAIQRTGEATPISGLQRSDLVTVLPSGAVVTYDRIGESAGPTGYALRLRTPDGAIQTLYTDAMLTAEARWSLNTRFGFRYPYIEEVNGQADDRGNIFISFVRQTNGSIYDSFQIAFDATGAKLWTHSNSDLRGECRVDTIFRSQRLALLCPGRYTNTLAVLEGPHD